MAFIPSIDNDKPSTLGDPRTAYKAAEFITDQFAKTLIVFLRHDFGERYFNIVDSFGSTVTFIAFAFIASFFLATGYDKWVVSLFLLGFIAMSLFHLFLARQRDRSNRRWHSRYPGTSYLAFLAPGNPFFVQRYIEPALVFFAGLSLGVINPPLGAWFIVSGISIAAVEQIKAQRFRNRMLDAIDAQIEAENLSAAVSGKATAEQTQGFVLPVPTYYSKEQREGVYNGMMQLDPALQAMVEETKASRQEPQLTQNYGES